MNERIIELLSIKRVSAFSRYDESHPLNIYLGLDQYGRKTLAIASRAKIVPCKSTNTINVSYDEQENNNKLYFSLLNDGMLDIFCKFCEDLIANTKTIVDDEKTFQRVVDRWNTWMSFFQKRSFMSEERIRGLVGELLFLRDTMIPKYGVEKALASYVGPDGSHKDFEVDNTWYEIKAPHNGWEELKISSVEQLESERSGSLIAISMDRVTTVTEGAISLNDVVISLEEGFSLPERDVLDEKLRKLGYIFDEQYGDYRYLVSRVESFVVKEGFPRLLRKDLPNGIVNARYDISRIAMTDYLE